VGTLKSPGRKTRRLRGNLAAPLALVTSIVHGRPAGRSIGFRSGSRHALRAVRGAGSSYQWLAKLRRRSSTTTTGCSRADALTATGRFHQSRGCIALLFARARTCTSTSISSRTVKATTRFEGLFRTLFRALAIAILLLANNNIFTPAVQCNACTYPSLVVLFVFPFHPN
jgi:hypothetical protein